MEHPSTRQEYQPRQPKLQYCPKSQSSPFSIKYDFQMSQNVFFETNTSCRSLAVNFPRERRHLESRKWKTCLSLSPVLQQGRGRPGEDSQVPPSSRFLISLLLLPSPEISWLHFSFPSGVTLLEYQLNYKCICSKGSLVVKLELTTRFPTVFHWPIY